MWYDPPKLPRGANSKFAGTAAASARPSARSPRRVCSPLALPQTPRPRQPARRDKTAGAARPRGLPSDLHSRKEPRSANRRSRAPPSPSLTGPSRSAILALTPRTPPPTHPGAAAAAARSGGYVIRDAAAGPAPRARSAAVETEAAPRRGSSGPA